MLESKRYSEKEIQVFEGVHRLLGEGFNVYTLKVADIATAAGIGKGTVYEYFATKEEIFARTALYTIEQELDQAIRMLAKVEGFRDKCYTMFDYMIGRANNHFTVFRLMLTGVENLQSFWGALKDDTVRLENDQILMFDTIQRVLDCGVAEGIIKPQEDREYLFTVISSAVTGLNSGACQCSDNPEHITRLKDNIYKMLVKSFQ